MNGRVSAIDENTIILEGQDSFDISETLECGQCFRFEKTDRGFRLIAFRRVIEIEQTPDGTLFYPTTLAEFEGVWRHYFDLDTDYTFIKETLSKNDPVMRAAIDYAGGIRILRQDVWECLVSFIISQNNNIPRIKRIIGLISREYGTEIGGSGHCAFPSWAELQRADSDALMRCNTGFRAKYILDAVEKARSGVIDLAALSAPETETDAIKRSLLSIKGVGEKVSDCVMLFSCGRRAMFPVDVWVRRVMSRFYFGGLDVKPERVRELAVELFGQYGGYAQQYLFHYARTHM